MRDADLWAGVATLVAALLVASPGLFGIVPLRVPYLVWLALLLVLLVALLATATLHRDRPRLAAFATAVLASWAVVLTAGGGGFLLVLLVIVAALGPYAVPIAVTAAVVLLNTAIAAISTSGNSGSSPQAVETVIVAGFYLLIQSAAVLSSHALLQERETRRRLTAAHVELRAATLERAEAARTAERLRISRDLHDAIGHQLTVLTLQLETAKHVDGELARAHIERAGELARSLLAEVRSTVGALRIEALGLEAALREMTEDLPGLEVTVDVAPTVAVDDVERAALIRAAQEIVTNTIRHAEATSLHLVVAVDAHGTVLSGRDNGRGAARVRLGNGLDGLRERFTALGGEVQFDGGDGFVVTARVPAA
nr:histidine kinase [Agrococcus sp. ARC_14]